jgi:hypothetical protein
MQNRTGDPGSSAATPVAARRFCRFRTGAPPNDPGLQSLPNDGMCLSAFLLVRRHPGDPKVLMGRAGAGADWGRIGAIDAARMQRVKDAWMLPSSHLLMFESPEGAARRIASEQLDLPTMPLDGPHVVSEAYDRGAGLDPHWDLHFLFEGAWPSGRSLVATAWDRLEFLDLEDDPRPPIARGHEDIVRFTARPGRTA